MSVHGRSCYHIDLFRFLSPPTAKVCAGDPKREDAAAAERATLIGRALPQKGDPERRTRDVTDVVGAPAPAGATSSQQGPDVYAFAKAKAARTGVSSIKNVGRRCSEEADVV
ncbi:hypothetical protein HPB47_001384 [Ixodes persulcatus]|uniref:Uncharacterized protein n=1 Tax=Ixodes persulcatus TaxID=34615 RepID=A0AC60PR21_IXOPE|nr:hypothetical protein HPB47_001384 [Ixodes persulcatus]